jgi:hypothetical protein
MNRRRAPFLIAAALMSACHAEASSPATVLTPLPDAAPIADTAPHAFHYDLVLASTEGSATTTTSFSLDVSDAKPASVSFMKNVSIGAANRADLGVSVKGGVTLQGSEPRLEMEVAAALVDAAGKVQRTTGRGAAVTPIGATTVIFEASEGGKQLRLSAKASAAAPQGTAAVDGPNTTFVLDVALSHTGPGVPSKTSALTLKLVGDAPATASATENVALSAGDAGATARQDVGTRVKASGHSRGSNLAVDFDLEMSAIEAATPLVRIRKIVSRAQVVAPFDKATTVFSGEEDGHRYEVTVTPHRAN